MTPFWWISIHFVCFCVSRFVTCERNYDWRQRKTQLWRRLMYLRVRMFLKSAVKDHKFCCSYDWLVTTWCRPIRSVITVMKQIRLATRSSDFVLSLVWLDRIGLHSVLLPLLIVPCKTFTATTLGSFLLDNKVRLETSVLNTSIPILSLRIALWTTPNAPRPSSPSYSICSRRISHSSRG